MRRCARRSAAAEPARLSAKSHTTTSPAKPSIRLSAPKPTSATDEAATPAISATAASATCHTMLAHASSRARRTSRARPASGAAIGSSNVLTRAPSCQADRRARHGRRR